ncbi:MAG: hypothetical protein K5756_06270 [Clostridiales bacterium]|nr:hypothetical protein [Clostridiales bacterium]
MKKAKRLSAVILTAFIIAAMMTPLFVMAHEADHDCIGENCPVCAVISACQNTIKALGSALVALAAAFACCLILFAICFTYNISYNKTPISLKVKLLN